MKASARLADLAQIEARIWAELDDAVHRRASSGEPAHEWRRAVLATQDAQGPQARSIVLRDAHIDTRELVLYADARSAKVLQLRQDPRAVLMCWSEVLGWQLRMRCRVEVETTGLDVTARWARIRHSPAAHDYLSPMAPGTPLTGERPQADDQRRPPPGGVESTWGGPALTHERGVPVAAPHPPERLRETFAVLTACVESVDWLELHELGHRRALFDAQGARWLVP